MAAAQMVCVQAAFLWTLGLAVSRGTLARARLLSSWYPCNVVINPGDTDLSDNGVQVSHDCLLLGVWVTLYIPVQGGLASSSRVLKKKAHAHTKPRKTLHLG